MSDENLDYLQEGFDANSITVPRLRSLLVKHNVTFPSSAKKPQLVQIFNENVAPQARKILGRYQKAKRSSMGIINADADDDVPDLPPPPSAAKSRSQRSMSPRKVSAAARIKSEEPDEPFLRSSPRQSRSASRQLQASDTDTVADSTTGSRTGRRGGGGGSRRTVTPQVIVKEEEPDDDDFRHPSHDDESFFSSHNPFQSGSSPPTSRPTSSRRRTTGGEGVRKKKNSSSRRRTDGRTSDSEDARYSDRPLTKSMIKNEEDELDLSALEPGEEFTAEAQLELEDEIKNGERILATRPERAVTRSPAARKGFSVKTPFLVLLTSMLLAYGVWYRQEKIAVGYCGLGRPATQVIPPDFPAPDWLVPLVEPPCEPCPAHAYCYDNFVVKCEPDFVLTAHPLSLAGAVPLPPTCEPDSVKLRRVKQVADKTVEELREQRAKYECGGVETVTTTEQQQPEGKKVTKKVETPEVPVEQLKEKTRKKIKRLNKRDFDDIWDLAIGEVAKKEEVEVVEKTGPGDIPNTYLHSTSLARLPLTCTVRRHVIGGVERHRLSLGVLAATVLALLYGRARYAAHRQVAARVPALVDVVLDRLVRQRRLGDDDVDDGWLFLPNLRDDVLRNHHSLAERERYWAPVRAVVEQNSNVRAANREGRSGEVGRAWEWIGPMDDDEAGGDGSVAVSRRRKSGRVSWGPDVKSEPTTEMAETKSKWEEARPFY